MFTSLGLRRGGQRLPMRYDPIAKLASGGMAEVWRALAIYDTGEQVPVAIKRVLPELAAQPMYRAMFEDEARLGMWIEHPNIVRVYDAREIQGAYLMIMELVDGTSLKSLLEPPQARKATMPIGAALFIVRELARALEHAHAVRDEKDQPLGLVHRDVSPHNVLLGKEGTVKLADFGLANASARASPQNDMMGGKFGYLAPEIFVPGFTLTASIDVFAAGVVLWEMLTGRRLFQRDDDLATIKAVRQCDVPPASTYHRGVPPELDALLAITLSKDPGERIPSAGALATELSMLLEKVDPRIGPHDVALMVAVARAVARSTETPRVDALLMDELAAFASAATAADGGAAPLDPSFFSRSIPPPGPKRRP